MFIAGIAVGLIAGVAITIGAVWWFVPKEGPEVP